MARGAPLPHASAGDRRPAELSGLAGLDWTGAKAQVSSNRQWRYRQLLAHAAVAALAVGFSILAPPPPAQAQTTWSGGFKARLEALALLESLNADLLSHDSATETLRRWCADHHLASASEIVAERIRGQDKPADDAVRATLQAAPADEVRYRRVRLVCGDRVLSEADNWYLPAKLSPEMNHLLEQTDTPFGVVVKPLKFQRHTLSAALLFSPLPEDWDLGAAAETAPGELIIPLQVIQHRAVLSTPAGVPFSLVVETYTDKVLPDRAP